MTAEATRNKEFCVTCDFVDDLLFTATKLTPQHLDDMMSYAASLGAMRRQKQQREIGRHVQRLAYVPAGLVKHEHDVANGLALLLVHALDKRS